MTIQTVLNVTQTSLVIDTAGHILGAKEPYLYDDATISPANFAMLQAHLNGGRLRLLTAGITVPSPTQGASLVSVAVQGQTLVFTDSFGNNSTVAIPAGEATTVDLSGVLLNAAGNPDGMLTGTIIRTDPTKVVAAVTWPDGGTGTFTGLVGASGGIDSYTISYTLGSVNRTYTQPTMTRDASGAVINRPAVTVTNGTPATPPTTLTLTASAGDGQVTVTPAGATGQTSYTLYRGTSTSGTQLSTTFAAYTDTGRTNGTAVNYYAVAANAGGQVTATASATPTAAVVTPTAPTIAAAAGDGQVTVTQTAAGSNVQSLSIRRNGTQVATALPYTDTGLTNGTTYTYTAVATSSTGATATSNSATATPAASVTAPTTAPTVTLGTSTVTTQPLTWTAVTGATAYDVEHKATSGSTWTVDSTAVTGTSYTVTSLTASTSYDYRVRARNTAGPGPYSAVVTASTQASGGGTTPTTLFSETFTDSNNVRLIDHVTTASNGAKWTDHPTVATRPDSMNIQNNELIMGTQGQTHRAIAPVTFTSADYTVTADMVFKEVPSTNVPANGLIARFDATAASGYMVRYIGGVGWRLDKVVSGTSTALATASTTPTPTVGGVSTVALTIKGSQLTFTVGGTQVFNLTDTTYTTAGVCGITGNGSDTATTGVHFDNFVVTTA